MCNSIFRLVSRSSLRLIFLVSFVLALLLGQVHSPATAQQSQPNQPASQLVQDGVVAYRAGNYPQAIEHWSQALQRYPAGDHPNRAIVHENLARTYQHIGETQTAISAWESAGEHYQASNNSQRFGRTLTEQAQVYIALGQQQRAAALLCGKDPEIVESPLEPSSAVQCPGGAYAIAETTDDPIGQAAALGSLAETYRLRGEYETAESILTIGLATVQNHAELGQYEASMLNSLGNTYARWSRLAQRRSEAAALLGIDSRQNPVSQRLQNESEHLKAKALDAFNAAIDIARKQADTATEMRAYLSLLSIHRTGEVAASAQNQLAQLIAQRSDSRETAYAAISLAKSYQSPTPDFACTDQPLNPQQQTWLETGLQIAERIQDERAKSFALGELGHIAECQKQWSQAIQLTNQAQLSASNALESADSLYLWEWQIGRIYNQQQQFTQAIAAYQQSIDTLDRIRTNILTANRDLQFDFRDTVAPIYRQYIELQLTELPLTAAPTPQANKQQTSSKQIDPAVNTAVTPNVNETLKTIDSLRLAELQNFFGDNCVIVASDEARDRLLTDESQTTIITSVVLPDHTALIANFSDGTTKTVWVGDTQQLESQANTFRKGLTRFTDPIYNSSSSEALYGQFIAPIESELERTQTQTLVFVQDGFLRNIPMSALYDGDRYLIEKYAVATTPALSLTSTRAPNRTLRALAVGIDVDVVTESGREFEDLDAVERELSAIAAQLPGSQTLLNEDFTVEDFKSALQETRYSILHLATHGQFSTVPEETFVVTGPNADGVSEEITFEQLEAFISGASTNREPLDLITLTACQTATGDDRATLGLAGVAIQAGARSAIASLWNLPDQTAAVLIPQFYSYLKDPAISKAQALQQAQVEAINADPKGNPGQWAPLVLIGNWQ